MKNVGNEKGVGFLEGFKDFNGIIKDYFRVFMSFLRFLRLIESC
jgi:hypothetical protein